MTTDVHALLGGYVADALDAQERTEFELHLATCASCSDEVRELRETVAELSHLVSTPPPPALREQILTRAAAIRPEPPVPAPAQRPSTGARLRRLFALAAALLVVVGSGAVAITSWQQNNRLEQSVQADTSVLAAPDVRFATTELSGGGSVTYAFSPTQRRGLVISTSLGRLPADRTYQLWTMPRLDPAQARPSVTFGGGAVRQGFEAPDDTHALAITVEHSGGATTPDAATMQAASEI